MTHKALAVGILALLFWPRKAKAELVPTTSKKTASAADSYFLPPTPFYPNQDPGEQPQAPPPPVVIVNDPQVGQFFPGYKPPTAPPPNDAPIYADHSIYDGFNNPPPDSPPGDGYGPFPPPAVDDDLIEDNRVIMSSGRSDRFRYVWLEGARAMGTLTIIIYDTERQNFFAYVPSVDAFTLVFFQDGKLSYYYLASNVQTRIRTLHTAQDVLWFQRFYFWYGANNTQGEPYFHYLQLKQTLKFWKRDYPQAPWPLDGLTAVADRFNARAFR